MIISTALCHIPFVGTCDSPRLQMAFKQSMQTMVSENNRHPYVIGNEFNYIVETSKLYRLEAEDDGNVIYKNDDFIILYYENIEDFRIYPFEKIFHTHSHFGIRLRYIINENIFKKGDLIYCYDGFTENSNCMAYGYNLLTAYNPFFGYPVEDALAIRKSIAEKMIHYKTEKIIIPITKNTILKPIYNNIYEYLPEIGDEIGNDRTIISEVIFNSDNIIYQSTDTILNLLLDDTSFNVNRKLTKLNRPIVSNMKVHRVGKKESMLFSPLDDIMIMLNSEYLDKIKKIKRNLLSVLGGNSSKLINSIIQKYYLLTNTGQIFDKKENLLYVIEIDLVERSHLALGDKLSNRYGGKGVISKIIDDSLMPEDEYGNKVDLFVSPLSVYGRMNFGQIIEGTFSRVINHIENLILKNYKNKIFVFDILTKFNEILLLCGLEKYVNEIKVLMNELKEYDEKYKLFIKDIKENGLYYEFPLFISIDISKITKYIEEKFGFKSETKIKFSREFIKLVLIDLEVTDFALPNDEYVEVDTFCSYIYYVKLYKIAEELLRVRDVGPVNAISKINIRNEHTPTGCSLGYMEHFCLISQGLEQTMMEFRNEKSDNVPEKQQLLIDYIHNGYYKQTNIVKDDSPTKKTIETYINLINN